jgi:hypothetical protein
MSYVPGNTHGKITKAVIEWFDNDHWTFLFRGEEKRVKASEWEEVWDAAGEEPDSRWPMHEHRVLDALMDFCRVYKGTDDENKCRGRGLVPGRRQTAEERAVHWASVAKGYLANEDLNDAMEAAGWAIHYVQDAVSPPHVDPWAEGEGIEACGAEAPHTDFEWCVYQLYRNRDVELEKNSTHNNHTFPDAVDVGDGRKKFRDDENLKKALQFLAKKTDMDWPGPNQDYRQEDYPYCESEEETFCANIGKRNSRWDEFHPFDVKICPGERPQAWLCYQSEIESALERAALLTEAMLIYIFDLRPPGGPPPGGANVDVGLIIDSSGSMRRNDPNNDRKAGASALLRAALDDDCFAVIDFDDDAIVPAGGSLGCIPDARESLIGAVQTIDSSGYTDIGAGLLLGCSELQTSQSGNPKAGLLLTDGQQEGPTPYQDQHLCFQSEGRNWPIYCVALGNANISFLEGICETVYDLTVVPPEELRCIYSRIREDIAGAPPGTCDHNLVHPGETLPVWVEIDPGQLQATFQALWSGSDVDMTLVTPSGDLIGPPECQPPDCEHEEGADYELYRIRRPEPGTWTVNLFGDDVPQAGETVTLVVTSIPSPDSTPPVSRVLPQGFQSGPVPINLAYEATDPPGPGGEEPSGVAYVELWYRYRGVAGTGGAWTQYNGQFTASPISFTPPSGSGRYDFYTIAVDNAGNREEPPAVPDATYTCKVGPAGGACTAGQASPGAVPGGLGRKGETRW